MGSVKINYWVVWEAHSQFIGYCDIAYSTFTRREIDTGWGEVYCHNNKIKILNHVTLAYESRSLIVLAWKVKDPCPAETKDFAKETCDVK